MVAGVGTTTTVVVPVIEVTPSTAGPPVPVTLPVAPLPDFANMRYPLGTCGDNTPEFELRNGRAGGVEWASDVPSIQLREVKFADLDVDGSPEAVVLLRCAHAMTDDGNTLTVWSANKQGYRPVIVLDEAPGESFDSFNLGGWPIDFTVKGSVLEVVDQISAGDPNCCRSTYIRTRYRFNGSRVDPEGPTKVLALSDSDGGYPHMALLGGILGGKDVSAIALPSVVNQLQDLKARGEFNELGNATCEAVTDGRRRCAVPYFNRSSGLGPAGEFVVVVDVAPEGFVKQADIYLPVSSERPRIATSLSITPAGSTSTTATSIP